MPKHEAELTMDDPVRSMEPITGVGAEDGASSAVIDPRTELPAPEDGAPAAEEAASGKAYAVGVSRAEPGAGRLDERGAGLAVRRVDGLTATTLFEYEAVMIEELAFEAHLVGAHAGGEREPEVGACQPAGHKLELQQ